MNKMRRRKNGNIAKLHGCLTDKVIYTPSLCCLNVLNSILESHGISEVAGISRNRYDVA